MSRYEARVCDVCGAKTANKPIYGDVICDDCKEVPGR